ncbi:MAG: rhodanese-like domain-containing protein [Verrucomicrobiota bacterium]
MKSSHIVIASSLAASLPSAQAGDLKISHVDPKGAAALIAEKKITVIDVRSPEEFADGHIQGAKNIDILDDKFESGLSALDKTQPFLVHCASGGRSTRSLEVFKKLGFSHIYHLDGGVNAWKAAAQPLVK